jgi:hypothetical protein
MSLGAVEHRDALRSIELFGTKVVPLVRAELARRDTSTQSDRRVHEPAGDAIRLTA